VLVSVAALAFAWSIIRLPGQVHALIDVMDAQHSVLERQLAGFGIDLFGLDGRQDLSQFSAIGVGCSAMCATPSRALMWWL
jgi:hypothetical protein